MNPSDAFETLVANYPGFVTMKDSLGYYTYCSPRFCELFCETDPSSFYTKTDWDIYPASVASLINQSDKKIMEHKQEFLGAEELFYENRSHETQVHKKPLLDANGSCVGVICYATLQDSNQANIRTPDIRHLLYETLIRNLPELVYWLDTNNVIVDCNEHLARLYNSTRQNVIGKDVTYLFTQSNQSKELCEDIIKNNREIIQTGKSMSFEEVGPLNGKPTTWISRKSPLHDAEGNVIGIFGVSVDITSRKEMEKALFEAKELAEIANKAKTDFIMNISHDIRTPFSGIIGSTELLLHQENNSEKRYLLETIEASSKHLLNMLNNVIEIAKSESKSIQEPEIFNLQEQFQQTAALFITDAKTKNIDLVIEQDSRIPVTVIGLKHNFQRIILNLIGNAMKFTEHGKVSVISTLINRSAYKAEIKIVVTDTGIGIPDEHIDKIFDKFHRVIHPNRKNYAGSGLGLSIVKQFVDEMGGTINISSELGKGTSIELQLQFELPTAFKADSANTSTLNDSKPLPEAILIIEDDYISRRIASMLLAHHFNSEIEVASDAKTALELCQQRHYQLIVTDIGLPDLGGPELALKLRELPNCKDSLIVGLTAHLAFNENDYRNRGIDRVLSKPLNAEVCETINQIWQKHNFT